MSTVSRLGRGSTGRRDRGDQVEQLGEPGRRGAVQRHRQSDASVGGATRQHVSRGERYRRVGPSGSSSRRLEPGLRGGRRRRTRRAGRAARRGDHARHGAGSSHRPVRGARAAPASASARPRPAPAPGSRAPRAAASSASSPRPESAAGGRCAGRRPPGRRRPLRAAAPVACTAAPGGRRCLDEPDRRAAVDERQDEEAAVAVAPQLGNLGGVGSRVVDVHDRRRLLDQHSPVCGNRARGRRPGRGAACRRRRTRPACARLPHGSYSETAQKSQSSRRVSRRAISASSGCRSVWLATAIEVSTRLSSSRSRARLAAEMGAAADRPRQLVDVVDGDAAVASGRARAGQEPGRRPAPDGDRRHPESPGGQLDAQ